MKRWGERVTLASSPILEDCAQVGNEGYEFRAQEECQIYREQLRRVIDAHRATLTGQPGVNFGCAAEEILLRVKSTSHDYGRYFEIEAVCETEAAAKVAYWLQDHQPEKWDGQALADLGIRRAS